ncbi:MAG: TIGR02281 family clan AA aspartic protease [Pseudomonadota bacterium]
MSGDDTAQLIYLVLLGGVLAGYMVLAHRQNMGQMLRQALLWGLIFLGVIAGFGLWQDVSNDLLPRQTVYAEDARVEVPRSRDGHYHLTLQANGQPVDFVVDTGATDIVLTRADAARVGLDLDALVYSGLAQTANGTVRSARARVETLALGSLEDRNVTVWVNEGELFSSLLGMAYLQRFERIEIVDNTLILHR